MDCVNIYYYSTNSDTNMEHGLYLHKALLWWLERVPVGIFIWLICPRSRERLWWGHHFSLCCWLEGCSYCFGGVTSEAIPDCVVACMGHNETWPLIHSPATTYFDSHAQSSMELWSWQQEYSGHFQNSVGWPTVLGVCSTSVSVVHDLQRIP